jgi:4-hydroxybenzoate polyprenyltransferase
MGKIRKSHVLSVSLAGLISGGLILVAANRTNFLLVCLSILGLSTYTFFKRRWWGGPFYNAWIVAALCLMAYFSGNGIAHQTSRLDIALISTLAATFWGYANFVLTGYFKDISADRATGYNTLPVVFGRMVSAIASDVFAVLFLVSAGIAISSLQAENGLSLEKLLWVIPAATGTIAALTAQIRIHKVSSDETAFGAISPAIHAYILILSAMASASRPSFILPAALLYAGFLIAMNRRPQKKQI